jgi:hypothetical protein
VKGDRFPQEGVSTKACPQMSWRLGRLRSASACFPRERTKQTRLSRRGWLRGREWERITRGVYAAALSRTQFEELAAWQLVLPRTAAFSHLTAARRGGPLLRQVIPLLDARSESAWESIMRVLHRAAEIPLTPQQEIFDEAGRFIARADLRIDGTRRIHEYDERDRALLATRWERHGFTSKHLRRDSATIIADADRLLGLAWNPRRLAAWQGLLDHSLLGRAGRARAYSNWRRAIVETGQMQQGEGRNMGGL